MYAYVYKRDLCDNIEILSDCYNSVPRGFYLVLEFFEKKKLFWPYMKELISGLEELPFLVFININLLLKF